MNEKWVTEKYAKSGEIVKWLLDECPGGLAEIRAAIRYDERWQRRWQEWLRDPKVRVDVETTLDGFLCCVGVSLSSAPDAIFGDPKSKAYRKNRKNTPQKERRAAIAYAKEQGTTKAAKKYNVTPAAVRYWIRAEKGSRGESARKRLDPTVDEAARMRLDNPRLSYQTISEKTGVPKTTIRRRVDKLQKAKSGVS